MKHRAAANPIDRHAVDQVRLRCPWRALMVPAKEQRVFGSMAGKPSHPISTPIGHGRSTGYNRKSHLSIAVHPQAAISPFFNLPKSQDATTEVRRTTAPAAPDPQMG